MNNDPLKYFVIEYSVSQNAIHVRTLRAVIENNRRNLSLGMSSDYVPIGLAGSCDEADKLVMDFYQTLAEEFQRQANSRNWHRVSEIAREIFGEVSAE
jgi:hypothetical protein